MNERDTKFQSFAKRLWQEVLNALDQMDTDMDVVDGCSLCSLPQANVAAALEPIIARRAYDLVDHAVRSIRVSDASTNAPAPLLIRAKNIPDLTEWPPQST